MEGAVEGVQEGGAEEVGDLGEGEVEVGEGVRKYGAIKVGLDRKMNLVEDHPDMASVLTQKRLEQRLERAMSVRDLEGRSELHICELHICSSGHYTGRF